MPFVFQIGNRILFFSEADFHRSVAPAVRYDGESAIALFYRRRGQ